MGRSTYLNIMMTLLITAVIFFSLQLLRSIDNLRLTNEKILLKMENLKIAGSPPVARIVGNEAENGSFANREYFDPAAEIGDRIVYALPGDLPGLNPVLINDAALSTIANHVLSSLFERNYGDNSKFEAVLAESITESPDHLRYTVKLRKGILWHNFVDPETQKEFKDIELTAHDFKFALDVILNEEVNCAPLRSVFESVEGVNVVDDYTFEIIWKEPLYLNRLQTMQLFPLPRHLYWNYDGNFDAENFNQNPEKNKMLIGCGPYKLIKYEKGSRIILERNDKYFGGKYGAMPALKYVVYEIVPHPNTRFQMLLAKDLDILSLTPEQNTRSNTPAFGPNGDFIKFSQDRMSYFYIGWNNRKFPFNNAAVRTAMTLLTDRERIIREVFSGQGVPISGPFYYKSAEYDNSIAPLTFDPQAAKELLAAAGWSDTDKDGVLEKDGKKFEFTLIYPSDIQIYEQILLILQENMAAAGVILRLQSYEWSVFVQKVDERQFDAYTMGWALSYDADQFQIWHSSQSEIEGGSNYIGYNNLEADELIMAMRREFDPAMRIALAHRFHQLIATDQPYTFLVSLTTQNAVSSRYKNIRFFPQNMPLELLWTPVALQRSVPNLQ